MSNGTKEFIKRLSEMNNGMTTPIEALAQEYATEYTKNPKHNHTIVEALISEADFKAGFLAGAKAASGRVAELEADLEDCKGIIKRSHEKKYPGATDYTIRLELKNQRYSQENKALKEEMMKVASLYQKSRQEASSYSATVIQRMHEIALQQEIDDLRKIVRDLRLQALSGAGKGEG